MNYTNVKYKKEFFSLINHLSEVNADIPIEKVGNRTVIKNKTKNNTIAFILDVSEDIIDFTVDGDKMAFQNFPEFFSLFGLMDDDSSIQVNDTVDTMVIRDDNSELSYNLGIRDSIVSGFNGLPVDTDNDIVMEVTNNQLKKIRSVLNTLPGRAVDKRIHFTVSEESEDLGIKVFAVSHSNKWEGNERSSVVEKNGDMSSLEICISSEIFKVLPELDDENYQINLTVCKNNFVKFSFGSLGSDAFSLDIYTSRAVG